MTETLVASATREAIIGFDRPFTIIGERINPTGRKKLAAMMEAGDFSMVEADALAQVAAGASILDINAGVTAVDPNLTEPPLLKKTIEIVQALTDIPLVHRFIGAGSPCRRAGSCQRPAAGQLGDR